MAQILPRDLTAIPGGTVNPAAALIIDNGDGVFKGTPANLVDAGAPINSQPQAEAGLVNTGRMTPLRVKQAIDALGVSQVVLASSSGSGMVGFLQSGTDAIAEDLQEAIRSSTGATPTQFGAVGDGTTDDGPALQKWLDRGGFLRLPDGTSYSTEQLLLMTQPGTVLTGGGKISIPERIVGNAPDGSVAGVITVTADNCTIDGIVVENPSQERLPTGTSSMGISVCANNTRVTNATVLDFEYGIALSPFGEFYDWWVDNCFIRVNGVGQLGASYGEDRGDGITGWGSRMHVTNNRVVGLAGTQCRGGIFLEGLPAFAADTSGLDFDTTCTVIGNQVGIAQQAYPIANPSTGNFRKGVDVEQVDRVIVSDNIIRSCAWSGIQLAGPASDLLAHHNIIYADTPAGDTNGSGWGPTFDAIKYYPNGDTAASNVRISGNTIKLTTAQSNAISANGITTSVVSNLVIESNQIFATVAMGTRRAIIVNDFATGTAVYIRDNLLLGGWYNGILANGIPTLVTSGNRAAGYSNFGYSFQNISDLRSTGDALDNATYGIELVNVASAVFDGFTFDTITQPEFSNAGTSDLSVANSKCIGTAGAVVNFGTLTVSRWRNNAGFAYLTATSTYDPASVAANAIGGASGNITVTGAQAGDRVKASFSLVTQGLVPMAAVSVTDTVIASFANPTAAPVDLGSGTMTVSVERG